MKPAVEIRNWRFHISHRAAAPAFTIVEAVISTIIVAVDVPAMAVSCRSNRMKIAMMMVFSFLVLHPPFPETVEYVGR